VATVRQSITALYEESQKSAADGAAMMAVINTTPVADAPLEPAVHTPPPAEIVARFDELRRLAEREAGNHADDGSDSASALTGREEDDAPIIAMDTHLADPAMPEPVMTEPGLTSFSADPEPEAEPADDVSGAPLAEVLPSTAVDLEAEAAPAKAADLTLPEEPPAPASTPSSGNGADLEIGDIQELVRQAWEDEAGIGHAVTRPTTPEQTAAADDPSPVPADIETAMEEIAAAVVQSGDSAAPVDVEAMKAEIIAAMRSEMKALLDADLTSAVRAAVADAVSEAVSSALADMSRGSETAVSEDTGSQTKPTTTAKPKAKAASKATPKKTPAARKASAKKAASKTVASKKAAVVKKLRADPTPDPDDA